MAARWRRAAPTRSLQNCWALTPPSGAYQPAKCSKGTLGELDIIDESEPTKGTLLLKPKPSLKIGTANSIYWNSLALFRDYGLNHIFLGNKTFLFFKIESWNFQHLFEKEIRETSQNFNTIIQPIEKMKMKIVWRGWMSWNFVRFMKFFFQQVSAFYLEFASIF